MPRKRLDIDWSKVWTTPKADRPDWQVAKEFGCSITSVRAYRQRLGIEPHTEPAVPIRALDPPVFKASPSNVGTIKNGKTVRFNLAIDLPADLFKAIQGDMFRETVAGVELIRQAIGKEHLSVETASEDPLAKRIAEHLGHG